MTTLRTLLFGVITGLLIIVVQTTNGIRADLEHRPAVSCRDFFPPNP